MEVEPAAGDTNSGSARKTAKHIRIPPMIPVFPLASLRGACQEGSMAQSPKLPYDPPFRYTRPANDLQAVFGAQIGNPRIPRAEAPTTAKQLSLRKSGPSAPAGKSAKASTVKAAKPAAPKQAAGKSKAKAKTRSVKR